jgi:hypothetical protein
MAAPTSTASIGLVARTMPVAVAATAGFVAGAIVGGVGGRLAMLLLRLTSDPSLHGLETDDGFSIGVVSASTIFLVMTTAVLGTIGGLVYLVVRTWLPPSSRSMCFGALTGVVGGSLVIHPGGIDFTLLDPLWLAIVSFVALPAAFGVVVAALVERWLRGPSAATSPAWLAGLGLAVLPLAFLGAGRGPRGRRARCGGGARPAPRRRALVRVPAGALAREGRPAGRRHRLGCRAREGHRRDRVTKRAARVLFRVTTGDAPSTADVSRSGNHPR